jgi:Zn ribbon nucleic-acid-binding protein
VNRRYGASNDHLFRRRNHGQPSRDEAIAAAEERARTYRRPTSKEMNVPTRKIADLPSVCRHPEHNPPSMMVYENGIYEHECPSCGHKQHFTVNKPTLKVERWRGSGTGPRARGK